MGDDRSVGLGPSFPEAGLDLIQDCGSVPARPLPQSPCRRNRRYRSPGHRASSRSNPVNARFCIQKVALPRLPGDGGKSLFAQRQIDDPLQVRSSMTVLAGACLAPLPSPASWPRIRKDDKFSHVDLRLLVRSFLARAIARHTLSARRRQDATGEIRTSGPP